MQNDQPGAAAAAHQGGQYRDDDEWAWPDSDDEDEERCIAKLKALRRMDFSAMDEDRRQHDSCSTAQAQAQEKKQAQAQAQAQEKEIYSK